MAIGDLNIISKKLTFYIFLDIKGLQVYITEAQRRVNLTLSFHSGSKSHFHGKGWRGLRSHSNNTILYYSHSYNPRNGLSK